MTSNLSKYKAIQGQLPTRYELAQWNEEKFIQFFEVVNSLTIKDKNGESKITCTNESIKRIEDEIMSGTPSFKQEVLYRINMFTTDPDATPRKFFFKIAAMIRNIGGYLKNNPALITEKIHNTIKDNQRLNWMAVNWKLMVTKIGAEIIVPNTLDTTEITRHHTNTPKDPQLRFIECLDKATSLLELLLKDISKKDIKDMDIKDRISAISKLSFILKDVKGVKANKQTFIQINNNKESRDSLENDLLKFSQE